MTLIGLAAFNLLLNAIPAFAVALAFSWGISRLLRIPPGRAQLALAVLPYAKLAYDLAGGIPDHAFLWQRAAGVPRDIGVFQIGVGTEWGLLRINMALGALSSGTQYPDSAADIAAALLTRKVSVHAPLAIAALLLGVAAVRLGARAHAWIGAERYARRFRAERPITHATSDRHSFPVYLLDHEGSPFSGGLWCGYIGVPRRLWHALPEAERQAALDHELAHLTERHLLVSLLTSVLDDLFWFVPGMARARRALSDAIESAADQRAIDRGHSALTLASALVRVAESTDARVAPGTCHANGASLAARVSRLLSAPPVPRLGCHHPLVRAAFTAWAAGSLLIAVAFGNH